MGLWTYQLENKIHQWWPWASRSEYLRPQYLQTAGWSPSRHIYSIGCPSAGSLPAANQTESLKWNLWKSGMTWEFAKKHNGSNIDDSLVRTKCAQLCNWNTAKLANKGEKLKPPSQATTRASTSITGTSLMSSMGDFLSVLCSQCPKTDPKP